MSRTDRTQARQRTRIAQAAAVLFAAGAVGAIIASPELPPEPEIVPWDQPADTSQAGTEPDRPEVDVVFLAAVLNQAGSVDPEIPLVEDEPVEPPPTTPVSVAEPTRDSGFRFLGGFFGENSSLAIIAGAGKQQMIRVGDTIDFGFKVESISAEAVELSRNGETTRIEREIAAGAVVATSQPETSVVPVAPSARQRLAERREAANRAEQAQRLNETDREKLRADYEQRRQQRLEALREQGVDVEDSAWDRDD